MARHSHSATDLSLSSIGEALGRYKAMEFQISTMTFQTEVDVTQPLTSARSILIFHDPINRELLNYEEWHEESLMLLKNISETAFNFTLARSLVEDLSALHVQILSKIKVELESRLESQSEARVYSNQTAHLLEPRIVHGIKEYRFSYSSSLPAGNNSDQISNHRFPHRCHPSAQLHWIDDMIRELKMDKEISPPRKQELLEGLEEHRRNVKADSNCQAFKRKYPHLLARAIITNSYKPIVLFGHAIVLIAMMVVSLKIFHQVSRIALSEILGGLRNALNAFNLSSTSLKSISQDPRTYEKVFDLTYQEELFAVCPKCASTYPLNVHGSPSIATCNSSTESNGEECGEALIHEERKNKRPIITFRYQKFEDWLHNLLSRPGMTETVNRSWENAQGEAQNPASDFWGGEFIREMKAPDGRGLFREVPKSETRLLFSLAVDWFNPYHNKIAGKSASIGIIVMTCLNIPPEDRYKDQNVYLVGVLPGPTQESQMNSILKPLVEVLLRLWEMGIYFIGIPGQETARLVRGALVQLICDLPAARKVAGFPGHSAKYNCSVCLADHKQISDIASLDRPFMARSYENHINHAKAYKNILETEGKKAAERFLKKTRGAVRWSVLNELPYWDPIKCVVLDSMHLLLLGLCQFHWRRFWNADLIPKDSKKKKNQIHTENNVDRPVVSNRDAVPESELEFSDSDAAESLPPPSTLGEDSDEIEEDISCSSVEGNLSPVSDGIFKQPTLKHLTAEKMSYVRRQWIYATSEQLHRLTTAEILCLLKENGESMPHFQTKKADLIDILIECRGRFAHLPKTASQRSAVAPRAVKGPERDNEKHTQEVVKSPSELHLQDRDPFKIPVLNPDPAKTSFVTRAELNEVQNDIGSIIVPSWFTKMRPTFGEKSNGKLKADEWRSLFTVYLPITFLRLWAESSGHRVHLKALLCLTILVNIVTSRTSSAASRELYENTVKTYLKFLHKASPKCQIVINHHMALHLTGFMALHGPCHSHWAFPFERIIGKMQKTLHNSRMADIPGILSRSFTSRAIMGALYQQGLHSALCSRWGYSKKPPQKREKRVALDTRIKLQIESLFGPTASIASSLSELTLEGVKYQCAPKEGHNCDANIGYLTWQTPNIYIVGRIQQILKVKTGDIGREETVLIVRRYRDAPARFSTQCWDEIFGHRILGLRVVGEGIHDAVDVVPMSHLIGHIAIGHIKRAYGVALITLQLTKDLHIRQRIPE